MANTMASRNREAGQALVVAALSLTVLLLAAGLSIDMGYLRYQKRRTQTAADSAAIAAASQLTADWAGSADEDAQLNGFKDGQNGVTVTSSLVNCPDGTAASCVQVIVSQPQPLFFMKAFSSVVQPIVTAQATAESKPGENALYALSTGPDAMRVGYLGEAFINVPGGGIIDNGTLDVEPGNPSHTITARSVGAGSYSNGQLPHVAPVSTPIQLSPDPLATTPTPSSPGTCGGIPAESWTSGRFAYPCGLSLAGTVNLPPGLYSVGGTGLSISNAAGTDITGTGVTFYVSGPNASVNVNAGATGPSNFGATIQLQAPNDSSSGGIPGVLVFQDPSDTQDATVTIASFPTGFPQTDSYMWGALYFPSAKLTLDGIGVDQGGWPLDGCSPVPRVTQVVAYKLALYGNINIGTNDCVWPPIQVQPSVSSAIKNAVLVK